MAACKFASFDQLAAKLIATRPKLPGLPAARSLSAYLSKLNRGDDVWFRHPQREAVADKIAHLLAMDRDELLPPATQTKQPWPFEAFPQLRPLDLEHEDPCDLFEPQPFGSSPLAAWLPTNSGLRHIAFGIAAHRNQGRELAPLWISAAPGSGKRLLAHWMEARGWGRCIEVGKLSEAVGAVQPQKDGWHVIVLVSEADPEGDAPAAQALSMVGGITVLAPFQFPRPEGAEYTQERQFGDEGLEVQQGWTIQSWKVAKDWRARLLHWVGKRLASGQGLYDADQLFGWLQKHDAAETILPTPGDLLPICALLDAHGPAWLNKQTPEQMSQRLLENLVERIPEGQQGRLWLHANAAEVLKQLLAKRLRDLSAPLRGGSSASGWGSYCPPLPLAAHMSESELRSDLTKLDKLKREEKRRAKDALVQRITAPSALETIGLLRQARVLRTDRNGGLSVHPRWTQEIYLGHAATHAVREEPPTTWGRWVVEPERRQLIDTALDQFESHRLISLVRETLSQGASPQIGWVGAVESLFAAVGRRLSAAWQPADEGAVALLHSLWRQAGQLRTARGIPETPALPQTRVDGYWDKTLDFFADCWAWSFWIPAPPDVPTDDPAWLWPGWRKIMLSDLSKAHWANQEPSWAAGRRSSSAGGDRLFLLGEEFLQRCGDTSLPDKVPSLFILHAVVQAAQQRWTMNPVELWWEPWHSKLLAAIATELDGEARRRIADWHVAQMLPEGKPSAGGTLGYSLKALRESDEPLYQFVLTNAQWDVVPPRLEAYTPQQLLFDVADLPEPLQVWAIKHLATCADASTDSLVRWLTNTRAPKGVLADRLLTALGDARDECGYELPRLLFRVDTAVALRAAERAWRREHDSHSTRQWFAACPASVTAREPILAVIRETPRSEWPAWTRGYLLAMLHYAGDRADEIFRLSQGLE